MSPDRIFVTPAVDVLERVTLEFVRVKLRAAVPKLPLDRKFRLICWVDTGLERFQLVYEGRCDGESIISDVSLGQIVPQSGIMRRDLLGIQKYLEADSKGYAALS